MTGGSSQLETSYRLLGPISATVAGEPVPLGGPRQIAVLTRLLLSPRRVVSLDLLAETIWGYEIPAQPQTAIRSYVSNLRKALEPSRRGRETSSITAVAPGYKIEVPDDSIDWILFERLLSRSRDSNRAGEPYIALKLLREAMTLWRGEPCSGIEDTASIAAFRSRLKEQHLAANELMIDVRIQLGEHKDVIAELETLSRLNPMRERLTELTMLALYRSGRQSDALEAGQRLRSHLLEKLGIDPGPAIKELEMRILNQDAGLLFEAEVLSIGLSSPPSIEAPENQDDTSPLAQVAEDLTPWSSQLAELKSLFRQTTIDGTKFALISGPYGSGKSRLVSKLLDDLGTSVIQAKGKGLKHDSTWLWTWTEALTELLPYLSDRLKAELVSDHEAIASVLPQLKRFVKSTEPSLSPKAHTFASVGALINLVARIKPVVLVLEDLQNTDRDSIDLLNYLVSRCQHVPLLVVATQRWSLTDTATAECLDELYSHESLNQIEIQGLPHEQAIALCNAIDSESLFNLKAIVEYCGANALFVTELANSGAGFGRPEDIPLSKRLEKGLAAWLSELQDEDFRTLAELCDEDGLITITDNTTTDIQHSVHKAWQLGVIVPDETNFSYRYSCRLVQAYVQSHRAINVAKSPVQSKI